MSHGTHLRSNNREPGLSPGRRQAARAAEGASAARGVLLPVAVVLTIGLIFVGVYLAAFHQPRPHRLPVAVVGTQQEAGSTAQSLDAAIASGFAVRRYADAGAAQTAVADRRAYASLDLSGRRATLLYAGANGPAVTALLTDVFKPIAAGRRQRLTLRDVRPGASGDTRALSIFYVGFGLVLAGFLLGTVTYQLAPHLRLRQRLLSLLLFGAAGGASITLIGKAFGALPGPSAELAGVIALMAIAAGSASMAFVRLLGGAGVSLGSVVLLVLGNSTSGGSLPRDFLPGWLRPLSEILPVGVGVRALDGLAYFNDDGLAEAVCILSAWIVVCVLAIFARERVIGSPRRDRRPKARPRPDRRASRAATSRTTS